jgi:hypothetical protein
MRLFTALAVAVAVAGCTVINNQADTGGAREAADTGGDVREAGGDAAPTSLARRAANVEAQQNLGSIQTGSKNKFEQGTDLSGEGIGPFVHEFCPNAGPTPSTPPTKLTSVPASDWAGWACLKFAILEKQQRAAYRYTSSGRGPAAVFTAIATADPDADGRLLTITLRGRGDKSGTPVFEELTIENGD